MNEITKTEVAESVEWLSGMGDCLDFDSADWSSVEKDGKVILEGYTNDDRQVRVVVQIREVQVL